MQNLDEIEQYYKEQLNLVLHQDKELMIVEVDRCLVKWHSVGVHLTSLQRQADAELFLAEEALTVFINDNYKNAWLEMKAAMGSGTPTAALVNSLMQEKYGLDLMRLKTSKHNADESVAFIKRLRSKHDRFVTVLSTYSANLRTDWTHLVGKDSIQSTQTDNTELQADTKVADLSEAMDLMGN